MDAVISNFDEYLKAFGLTIGLFVVSGIASLVLGTILGYMLESSFRRSLLMSNNDYTTFVTDPIAGGMLAVAALFVASSIGRSWWVSRRSAPATATSSPGRP